MIVASGASADVVVVGAGPAGAMTAHLLAHRRSDLRIVLWERQASPGPRPCGEFLSPDGVRILAAAGVLPAVERSGAVALSGLELHAPSGRLRDDYRAWMGQAPPSAHGLGLRRERFDRILQDAAAEGATLVRGVSLRALERSGEGWVLHGTAGPLRARMVVGADGRHSAVRRLAGLDLPDRRPRFALACRARGIPHGDRGEMHLGPLGQVGLAPVGEGEVNLNLLLAERSAPLLRRMTPDALLRAALRATPSLRARGARARLGRVQATGRLPQRSRSVVAPGLALVGDAATFCDPFTGEGICLALQGAELLAARLAAMPDSGPVPDRLLRAYATDWARHFGPRLRLGRGLQSILTRRGLAEHLVAGLGRIEAVNRLFIAVTGDYAHPLPRAVRTGPAAQRRTH